MSLHQQNPSEKIRLVVIGNGMVGHQFVESVLENSMRDQFRITVFGAEPRAAYDRVHLTEFFREKKADSLAMTSPDYYAEKGVELILGDAVETVCLDRKEVTSAAGLTVSYDRLILATGSVPFIPPVEGNDRDNCFVYRTIEDLEAIVAAAENGARSGVVIGGGLLGLEAAKALTDLGMKADVVEFAPRLMAVQLDDQGGALLRDKIGELGVGVHLSRSTSRITDGEHAQHRMEFSDGEFLETDMIIFSAGIRPQDILAKQSGLETGERGGIVINDFCQTSDPTVYAIGECALWQQRIFGLVAPGYSMARTAASHICGGDLSFRGADMSTKLKLMGVDVASIGDAHGRTSGAECYTFSDQRAGIYKKLVVSEDGRHLLGAILVGDAGNYGILLQYMLNQTELPEFPDSLILPQRDGQEPAGAGVAALPGSAQICSCNNVTRDDVGAAVGAGCCSLAEVKDATRAGTSCGGCVPLLTSVVNHELEELGVEVSRDLCEHFGHTRQELYHLVRVDGLRTFSEVLSRHGSGLGCEVCRQAVGSVLASCWNEYVLKDEHIGQQDTNDIFLGNMQKDGTYSVVPRVPGGEITPDKLIVIGEVARDFGLYTKITGGQRIDLFGAQLHELPEIWTRLIDAGFETGHAYGKSLRTVKSCVGSTWCRFGVDDSAGLAIELENRYKGLRAPHKIKFGVSGCTRECAEAQSKDVGVIATEKGWNLYVCGNGGMKPRHTELLAADLDKETLIRYIDRFLMFYIRTADRLQRTSVWRENLDGGLEYLRAVVIDDSLGIAETLEREMQLNIDAYQCEWATTLSNPEKLKRFRHFINSDKADDRVVFTQERGQIRPVRDSERENLIARV